MGAKWHGGQMAERILAGGEQPGGKRQGRKYSGSSIIGMMASKNVKKSWYCEFQVHYRALINLNYRDFPGKYPDN